MIRRTAPRKTNKWQLALYLLLLVIVVACMVALSRCDKPVPLPEAHTASGGDTIDVAIEYSPVIYYTYDDTLGGYDYDLLRMLSQVSRRPMKFHPIVTLQKGLDGLGTGTYDVLVAQFPTTAQNREKYVFTEPIYIDQQVLVQQRPARVHAQLELAGDTVHVVKGSPMVERIHGLSREIGDTIHIVADETYGPEQLVMLVASGDIRMAVVNKSIASALAARLQNIDISVDVSLSQFQAWALNKGNTALRDSLNSWLERVDTETLKKRYFGQ